MKIIYQTICEKRYKDNGYYLFMVYIYTTEIKMIQLIINKIDSIVVIKIKDFFITKIMPRVYKL